eukprot:4069803-Prymnesium_polylepis.2
MRFCPWPRRDSVSPLRAGGEEKEKKERDGVCAFRARHAQRMDRRERRGYLSERGALKRRSPWPCGVCDF